MSLDREPADIARDAAEAIRALQQRTLDVCFDEPTAIHRTCDELRQAVQSTPQALIHIWMDLQTMEVRLDNGTDGRDAKEQVRQALNTAHDSLTQAGEAMERATQLLSHMRGLGNG
ncbi:hypothetical protein [Streptomyces sp. NPDC058297]|uniref:hypothetical protein n=1 Tax=Streptomyces sp. NPDC058297 TaxID=3346433 RepID=UPI0036E9D92B